ncbi:MAG: META domain-containing protein [Terricaulis sp.]
MRIAKLLVTAVLGLAACTTIPRDPEPLAGSSWHRTDDADASPHYATIVFAADSASGYAGCNTWSARSSGRQHNQFRGAIQFGPVATTRMMCPPSSMHTEQVFLPVLQHARQFEWSAIENGAELRLFDGRGALLAIFECDDGCPADIVSMGSRRR